MTHHFNVHTIRLTPEVFCCYRETIALHAPETFALLGGRLDDPFLVDRFRFVPPGRTGNGELDSSAVHINVDADLLNWIIDHEWKPSGRYLVGIWHSHPNGTTRLSTGDAASNTGDIAFFTSCLENDDSPERNWRYLLAPLTTFRADGSDEVHGWVLKRGERTPRRARVIVDPFGSPPISDALMAFPSWHELSPTKASCPFCDGRNGEDHLPSPCRS